MLMKVYKVDGVIIHIGEWDIPDPVPENAVVEWLEMYYDDDIGWVEKDKVKPKTDLEIMEERLARLILTLNVKGVL